VLSNVTKDLISSRLCSSEIEVITMVGNVSTLEKTRNTHRFLIRKPVGKYVFQIPWAGKIILKTAQGQRRFLSTFAEPVRTLFTRIISIRWMPVLTVAEAWLL
jgi:hypothetical protein